MKKVGIMHYTGPGKEVGGVEVVISDHTRLLNKMGYQIHLIYGHGGGLENQRIANHKIPLLSPINPSIRRVQSDILKKFEETQEFKKLREEIKEDLIRILPKLDACIIHNIPSMPFNYVATAAINEIVNDSKTKLIFWLHDSILCREGWNERFKKFPFSLLHFRSRKIIYVAPTAFRANQFAQLPEPYRIPSMKVIPNGVDIEEYIKIDETTKLLMKKLGITFEDFVLLAPVRMTPRKNIELALHVTYELKGLMGPSRSIRLLITGPPDHQEKKLGMDYFDHIRRLAGRLGLRHNVIFCFDVISHEREYENGGVKKWSVGDVYNIADLVFIPSKEEGFGLPVIEAGAARKPIFCSRILPFKELIKDDIEGHMFDLTEEPKNIAFRIHRLLLEDRVENNFNNVIRRFSWEFIVPEMLMPLLQ